MKSTSLTVVLATFLVLIILQVSCNKNDIKSSNKLKDDVQQNEVIIISNEVVKNFIPDVGNTLFRKSSQNPEQLLSSFDSAQKTFAGSTSAKISGCGGSFSRSYSGQGYYTYPQDTIDVSTTVEGSTINVQISAYDVPNRFTIYDALTGNNVASSPWMGYANYSGPWGISLNQPSSGTLYFTRTSSNTYYLKVETSVKTTSDA